MSALSAVLLFSLYDLYDPSVSVRLQTTRRRRRIRLQKGAKVMRRRSEEIGVAAAASSQLETRRDEIPPNRHSSFVVCRQ